MTRRPPSVPGAALRLGRGALVLAAAGLGAPAARAQSAFADRAAFIATTGAAAEPEWPNLGHVQGGAGAVYQQGRLTLSVSAPSSGFWVGSGNHPLVGPDWTTLVEGNDIAIDGRENLNIDFSEPIIAVGFDFAEPTGVTVLYAPCSPLCPCANSSFRVTLLRAGTVVGEIEYSRPDDTAAFVGIAHTRAFDRIEIREMGGTCDDEYFGRFYIRTAPPPCAADFNADGNLDPDDLADYIACYFTAPPCTQADFDGSGNVDPDDLSDFIAVYFTGCG